MGTQSDIEWTDASWNVVTGCDEISPECDHCYAHALTLRLQAMGRAKYAAGWNVATHPECLDEPRTKIRKPSLIFTCSMSDLYHARVGYPFVEEVWEVMRDCPQHIFQVLTKRPERMARFTATHPAPANVWLGTSVGHGDARHRIATLRACQARIRFLSCEPLITALPDLDLAGISWVIVGGESGPDHRFIDPSWVRDLRDQCVAQGIAFFFKQWGGRTPKARGRTLDGRVWNQFPDGAGGVIDLGQDPLPRGHTIKMTLDTLRKAPEENRVHAPGG
jgi:protein gp37